MRRAWWYLLAVTMLVVLIGVPLVMFQGEELQGADDQGADRTGADPWFDNVFNPPEGSEPLLFALVALAGMLVIAFLLFRKKSAGGKR